MARGKPRWGTRDLKHRFPLRGERQFAPRYDGVYRTADAAFTVQFASDGTVRFCGEAGTWSVVAGSLTLNTDGWQGEGTIDVDRVYLLCVPISADADRVQLELTFSAPDQRSSPISRGEPG